MEKFIILKPQDNVATALQDIKKNTVLTIDGVNITLNSDINFEHKFALKAIKKGELVIKYGVPIGIAYKDISLGDHVHMHNLKSQQIGESADDLDKEWSSRSN